MPEPALIVVDVQRDFMPGGALAIDGADAVVAPINAMMEHVGLVVATQDWHPADHLSFASNHPERRPGEVIEIAGLDQHLWPDHCVQHTDGAAFVDALAQDRVDRVFQKGADRRYDSYSGFYDNGHHRATGLGAFLDDQGVDAVLVAGVATDYCVKYTVLDACRQGLDTHVVADACRGVCAEPGAVEHAFADMVDAGARVVSAAMVAG